MSKRIKLSSAAKLDVANILEYLFNKWNKKVADGFIDLFEEHLKRIAENPKQFPHFRKDLDIRKCVLTKHNTIYYRENIVSVQIVRVYDTRQNPIDLKF